MFRQIDREEKVRVVAIADIADPEAPVSFAGEAPRRISLPGYRLQRRRHRI